MNRKSVVVASLSAAVVGLAALATPAAAGPYQGHGGGFNGGYHGGGGFGGGYHGGYHGGGGYRGGGWGGGYRHGGGWGGDGLGLGLGIAGLAAGALAVGAYNGWGYGYGDGYSACPPVYDQWGNFVGRRCY